MSAVLRKTLYGQDLTPDLSDEMLAAAKRRLERREKALEEAQKLVDANVAPASSLETFQSDLDSVKKEIEIADSRAKLTLELAEMAKAEEDLEHKLEGPAGRSPKVAERHDGDGVFNNGIFARIESAFEKHFGKPLPVSAMGRPRSTVDGLRPSWPRGRCGQSRPARGHLAAANI